MLTQQKRSGKKLTFKHSVNQSHAKPGSRLFSFFYIIFLVCFARENFLMKCACVWVNMSQMQCCWAHFINDITFIVFMPRSFFSFRFLFVCLCSCWTAKTTDKIVNMEKRAHTQQMKRNPTFKQLPHTENFIMDFITGTLSAQLPSNVMLSFRRVFICFCYSVFVCGSTVHLTINLVKLH